MLDWSKIDNWIKFQKLVNHLFALECNSPGFIPSNPYIGADGGWDGYYEGKYRDLTGIWSIQSKWTSKSGEEAASNLKPRIRKEFANVQKNKVKYLIIATNADLGVDQVKELQKLNRHKVFTLRVWAREDLERRIELQPFLKGFFFGQPQYPKFVPWDIYFADKEKHLLETSSNQIPIFEHYINDAKKFIISDSSNILLIHSPGGYGKTHLLKEIAKIAHETDPERQPWLVKPYQRKMEDAIQDEIIPGRKYLLIFDDADRALEEIKTLLSICNDGNVKAILALRTSGLNYIRDIISDLRCEETYEEISISNWSKNDLISLLRISAGQKEVDQEEAIAIKYGNPYLIVWIGKLIEKEPRLDFGKLKERFIHDLERDAKSCLHDILDFSQTKNLLLNLSCIVPLFNQMVPLFNQDVGSMEELAKQVGIEIEKLNECLNLLQQAGVLRSLGYSMRFNPDMKGDLFLAYELEKDNNKLDKLMISWFDIAKQKLIINLESAARRANIPYFREMLSKMVNQWILEASDTPVNVRKERLRIIQQIALRIPDESFDLLNAYLGTEDPPANDPMLRVWGDTILTADDYGPIIEELLRVPQLRSKILEFIVKLAKSDKKGTTYNYKPESLISYSVSPLHNSIPQILDTLDFISKWLENPEKLTIELISSALSEVLAGSHEYIESGPGTITVGDKILQNNERIHKIRDKALLILESMIINPLLDVRLKGIEIAKSIGKTRTGMIIQEDIPLSNRIAEDIAKMVECIENIISPKMDFDVLSEIEDLFLSWWIWQYPGADNVKEYLRNFPRSPEYIAFRYFVSPEHTIEDFCAIETEAPEYNRFSWFNERFTRIVRLGYRDFKPLSSKLNQRYETKESLTEFLINFDQKISSHNPWSHPPIVSSWVTLNPDLFESIRNQSDLWDTIPQRFKNEIDSALAEYDENHLDRMANEIFTDLPNTPIAKVDNFLRWITKHAIDKSMLDCYLSQLMENGNEEDRTLTVFYLVYIPKYINDTQFIIKHLKSAISKETKFSEDMISNLGLIFSSYGEELDKIKDGSLNEFREQILEKIKNIPAIDYNAEEIIKFACDNIDSIINFINYRLWKQSKNISSNKDDSSIKGYDAIPYNGLTFIAKKIRNFADYEKFMDKVIDWYEEYKIFREFSLKYLMEPLIQLADVNTGICYLEKYIEKQLQCDNIQKAIIASDFLNISDNTISIIIKVAEKGIGSGLTNEVRRIIRAFPSGVYWSRELNNELVDRKKLFEKMSEITNNPILKSLLRNCIKIIENDIKQDLMREEALRNL